jgi:hypothetical protein
MTQTTSIRKKKLKEQDEEGEEQSLKESNIA